MVAQGARPGLIVWVFPAESNARVRGALMENMAVLLKNGFGRRALSRKGERQLSITQSCSVGLNLPDNHPRFVHGAAHFGFVVIPIARNDQL